MSNKITRKRRAKKTRAKIKELNMPRLSVHRTPRHIYAQLIMPDGKVVVSVSTLNKEIKKSFPYGGNMKVAAAIGKLVADAVKKNGISKISFDRSGFKYHGRIKALADAARENGLEF